MNHFVEKVIERADQVRACCINSQPADPEILEWLLSDARETARALSALHKEISNEQILELLLCLANLQDYIAHHSVLVKQVN